MWESVGLEGRRTGKPPEDVDSAVPSFRPGPWREPVILFGNHGR